MIRVFHVYYPVRTLVLLIGETIFACMSFVLAVIIEFGPDSYLVLNYEEGFFKILAITTLVVVCSYYFDLYDHQRLTSRGETYFRLLLALGTSSFAMATIGYYFPRFMLGRHVYVLGLAIFATTLMFWRIAHEWLSRQPYFCEHVYVLGSGERAARIVDAIRNRKDLGMEIVGWAGALGDGVESRDSLAGAIRGLVTKASIDRLIIAVSDRRRILPLSELLELRLTGIRVEEASSLLEKISGKIEVDNLHPSALIYSEGFRLGVRFLLVRRVVSMAVALVGLVICLPLVPFIAIAITLSSPGPVLFRQQRVGKHGQVFTLYKFRTMRQDAETEAGAVWAGKNDPRVTRVGSFLRRTRLDEIPQLWNVLKGDMSFVGPRPERPEFVQWLEEKIPYYNLRHIIPPGITGWAQIRYRYGASLEDSKEKLQYDLYYIKHLSLALDLFIMFQTIKTIILRRGAQ